MTVDDTMEDLICSVLGAINNLVLIHSIEWKVCIQLLGAWQQLLDAFPSSRNVILALKSAHYVLDYAWSQRSIGNECDVECDEEIVNLTKKILHCCITESEDGEDFLSSEVTKHISQIICVTSLYTRKILQDWPEARDNFRKILELCYTHKLEEHENLRAIVHAFIDLIKNEMVQFEPVSKEKLHP